MAVQFGRWNFDGHPPSAEYMRRCAGTLVQFGRDGQNCFSEGGLSIICGAFHTTTESKSALQPYQSTSGAIVTWDGRLDNRAELQQQLPVSKGSGCPDVLIVAAAYEHWGIGCFAKLIGDWALSLWIPAQQSLLLAKDPMGSRHLYYSADHREVTWSSVLQPLVLCSQEPLELNEEYLAGWLSSFPSTKLSPYLGVFAVPPSSVVSFTLAGQKTSQYWDFDPERIIQPSSDAEYEEQFRCLFGQAVQRRLRCDGPVLAELSGGMDSSSIVCTADKIIASQSGQRIQLDTVSYHDETEPGWNERPYFTKVEERRGKTGCHIDVSIRESVVSVGRNDAFFALPSADARPKSAVKELADYLTSGNYRILLSGIGGDEVMGGVPTPLPELEELLARARFKQFIRQLNVWALEEKRTCLQLLGEVLRKFLPSPPSEMATRRLYDWIRSDFADKHWRAICGYPERLELFGARPSFQENMATLEVLRRQLACFPPPSEPHYEVRYPYLDRDLLEFIYAIPREQLVRPGQRRSLMKRAMRHTVPREVLERSRKAFLVRSPSLAVKYGWDSLIQQDKEMITATYRISDSSKLRRAISRIHDGVGAAPVAPILRMLFLEAWMRKLASSGVLRQRELKQSFRLPSFIERILMVFDRKQSVR